MASMGTSPSASLAEFWGEIQVATAPVVLFRRKLGEAQWGEVAAGVYRHLAERLGEGPVAGTGRAYLGVGRK